MHLWHALLVCNVCFSVFAFLCLLSSESDALGNVNNVFTNIWFVFPILEDSVWLVRVCLFLAGVSSFLAHLSTVYSGMPGNFDWYEVDVYFVILVMSSYAYVWIFPPVGKFGIRHTFAVCSTALLLLLLHNNTSVLFYVGPNNSVKTSALLWIIPSACAFPLMLWRVFKLGCRPRHVWVLLCAIFCFGMSFLLYMYVHSLWHVWICTTAYVLSSLWRMVHLRVMYKLVRPDI